MGHGWIGDTIWGDAIPTAGPVEPGDFTVGLWLQFDTPVRLRGFRAYSKGVTPWFAFFQLWDTTPKLVAEQVVTARENQRVVTSAGWRAVWLSPQVQLDAATPYLLAFSSGNDVWRDGGVLTGAEFVNGPAKFLKASDAPAGVNGVYDAAHIGSSFVFTDPPADDAGGNMYGIDVFYRVIA